MVLYCVSTASVVFAFTAAYLVIMLCDVKLLHVGVVGIYPSVVHDKASWSYNLLIRSRVAPVPPYWVEGGIGADL